MIRRIIYFIESPFRHYDYERYGIEILIKNGFEIEIWDFTPFLYSQVIEKDQNDLMKSEIIHVFNNINDAICCINKLSNTDLVFIHIGYSFKHLKIYKHLSKSKARYLVTYLSNIPIGTKNSGILTFNKIKKILYQPSKILKYFFYRIPFKFWGIRAADFVLAAGLKSKSIDYPIDKNTEFIWAHTYEYNQYLSFKNSSQSQNNNKYCIFIDQNIPFHIDFHYDKKGIIVEPIAYYCSLEKLFKTIEHYFNIEVIFSAHPKTNIDTIKKYLKNRKIVKGKTIELIINAHMVLAHYSTAILYAVLFYKPIIFITNNSFIKHGLNGYICNWANLLGARLINTDNEYNIEYIKELSVNMLKYNDYIEQYIKRNDSPLKHSSQILADRLKQIV